MKLITAEMLEKAGACDAQVLRFRGLAPEGLAPTLKNLKLCRNTGLNVLWAASLLRAPARAEYDKVRAPARAEYDKVCAAACAEYDKVCAAACAEYGKVRDAAYAEYDKVCAAAYAEYGKVRDAAYAEYDKVCAAACAEYDKVCAAALIKALRSQKGYPNEAQ